MGRGMSRASRLQRIEELLMTAPDGYTTAELADRLTVHRTTIWRDLEELSRHAPVQQIDDRYFIDRSDYLSSVRLTRGESLMLYLALRRMIRHPSAIRTPIISPIISPITCRHCGLAPIPPRRKLGSGKP
jgi:predicted DNA-binding transcriptional regulator YafY